MTWQPIASAPRDGTLFWGLVENDAIRMWWHAEFGFVSAVRRMDLHDGSTHADTGLPYRDHSPTKHDPAFWMPVPTRPVTP